MVSFSVLFVWVQFLVVFWMASLTVKLKPAEAPEGLQYRLNNSSNL